jgi:hypothetical protein
MNIPIDLKSPINVTAQNLAKMTPANKTDTIFRVSLYGIPTEDNYQGKRLQVFTEMVQISGVPLYIGEWNNIVREKVTDDQNITSFEINEQSSDMNQTESNIIIQKFKDMNVWGSAFWIWNYKTHPVANYNLVQFNQNTMKTTKYFDFLKNSTHLIYKTNKTGNSGSVIILNNDIDNSSSSNSSNSSTKNATNFILNIKVDRKSYTLTGKTQNTAVAQMSVNPSSKSIVIELENNNGRQDSNFKNTTGMIEIAFPQGLISNITTVTADGKIIDFERVKTVSVNGDYADYKYADYPDTLRLFIPENTKKLEIARPVVTPEFPNGLLAAIGIFILFIVALVSSRRSTVPSGIANVQ